MGKNKKKSKSTSTPTKNGATTANNQSFPPRTNHNSTASWSSSEECAYYARLGCHIAAIAKANDATCSRQRRPPPRHDDRYGNALRRGNGRGKKHKQSSKRRTGTNEYENENYQNPTSLQKVLEEYPWILGMERFDPEEYHPEDIDCIPDIALNGGCDHVSGEVEEEEMVDIGRGEDENESDGGDDGWQDCDEEELGISGEENDPMTLTLTNVTRDTTKICFVTVYDVDLCGRDGSILQSGWAYVTTSFDGGSEKAVGDGGKEDAAHKNDHKTRIRVDKSDWKEENSSTPVSTKTNTTTIRRKCTTFIVLCPPQTFIHLCSLAPNQFQTNATTTTAASAFIKTERNLKNPITKWSQIEIESDIQPWSYHQNIDDEHPRLLHFPFQPIPKSAQQTDDINESNHDIATTNDNANDLIANVKQVTKNKTNENTTTPKAYLCTQSENGHLTHFFHGNYHAIDFACSIGTPLYSAVDGVVVAVKDDAVGGGCDDSGDNEMESNKNIASDGEKSNCILEVSGIATKNLFYWNSIMIRANTNYLDREEDDPLYIEYVHIQTNSSQVKVGDTVRKGQWICNSGSVGFSPEPHLHLAAYRGCGDKEPTVRVRFACRSDDADDVGEVKGKGEAFLPRAGGWYTERGLVELS